MSVIEPMAIYIVDVDGNHGRTYTYVLTYIGIYI